jgi:ribosomal protein S18 acetylase RimI-like enzyme
MRLFKRREPERTRLDLSKVQLAPFNNDLHICNVFDCGHEALNRFLRNKAKSCAKRKEYSVQVATIEGQRRCIGYYALQMGSDTVPETRKHKKSYVGSYTAFPAVDLSYLAVDKDYQRNGLGNYLLQDVFQRLTELSDVVGFYALTVTAIDQSAAEFYKSLNFEIYVEGEQPKLLYPLVDIVKLTRGG